MIYHALADLGRESLCLVRPDRPYICLGFSQEPAQELDLDFCARAGLNLFRREAGGGHGPPGPAPAFFPGGPAFGQPPGLPQPGGLLPPPSGPCGAGLSTDRDCRPFRANQRHRRGGPEDIRHRGRGNRGVCCFYRQHHPGFRHHPHGPGGQLAGREVPEAGEPAHGRGHQLLKNGTWP